MKLSQHLLRRYIPVFFLLFFISLTAQTDKLLQKLATASKQEKIEIYQQLALKYSDTDPKRAIGFVHQGLELLRNKNSKDIGYFYFILGRLCNDRSEYEKALFYYNKTIEIAEGIEYGIGVAKTHQNIGLVYEKTREYYKALDHYLKAVKIYEKENEEKLLISAFSDIGTLYSCKLKDDKSGLGYYNKALNLSKKINDTIYRTNVLSKIGEAYIRQQEFEQAKNTINRSIAIAEEKDIPKVVITGFRNLSTIAIEENNLTEAISYTQKSLELRIETGETNENATEYLRLATIYEKLGNNNTAATFYQMALSTAQETKNLPQLSKVYDALQSYYNRQEEYKKGYEYLIKYNTVKDSLFAKEKHEQLREIQAKFDLENKEKEVQLLTNENKIKALENKSQQTTQILLIIGMIALTVVLLALFYAYKNKQKTNKILEEKNQKISQNLKDREILLKEVHHRVKNNLQIVLSLLRLQHQFGDHKSSVEIIQEIQNKIQAMAIIHERLYKSSDLSLINLQTYLGNLLDYFQTSYDLVKQNVTIDSTIDDINLDMDYLVPCGLIVNEIIANSIKYAFKDNTKGTISIKAIKNEENECVLTIKDSGVGFPKDFDIKNTQSLGMQLIQGLTKQIKGSLKINSNPGACYTIKFSIV